MLIKDATNFDGRPKKKASIEEELANPPSRKIFVGSLSFDTTKEDLEEYY